MDKFKDIEILIAEDDDGHAELIQEGLSDAGVINKTIRFSNGLELWNFLSLKNNNFNRDPSASYLVLLDINMPLMDGVEVLRRIKTHVELKDIPVLMLSTTDEPREVENCYALGCNYYITKPVNFTIFTELLKKMGLSIQIIKT